ncbi:Mdm1p KNAG_0G03330 [Huiozyma naganishii CBS 8797]|uniref:PXA domain-containing protein n=1 Tax=Huiozyma naganishii (strain ATCC MYA-139 / BCRC 22969 / CBS 8797 / KCTC 17520 / NBRC 10181 / NCYC 3082 / Yp74L-3) TaxID=1071383 RepID=J7S993_HUIN7|nr:hypothetical protein KNAG_0G03330 [Kazachstania naganishii CBS 8797]CCK71391.1 hypothetical protein KNAG_0G03330 [Kazachstania naganishii CBS 8797]
MIYFARFKYLILAGLLLLISKGQFSLVVFIFICPVILLLGCSFLLSLTFPIREKRSPVKLNAGNFKAVSTPYRSSAKLFPANPEISGECREIASLIVRDYIIHWFQRIDPDFTSSFPDEVQYELLEVITVIGDLLSDHDITNLLLLKLTPLLTKYLASYHVAREKVLSVISRKDGKSIEWEIALELSRNHQLHNTECFLHQFDDVEIEKSLRQKVARLLPHLITERELESSFVFVLVREIITTNVLTPAFAKYTDPDVWNAAIIRLGRKILKERTQIQQVRNILTRELTESTNKLNDYNDVSNIDPCSITFDLTVSCTGREFESYLRQLTLLATLSDLRATKFALAVKLLALEQKKTEDKSDKREVTFKKRLVISLNIIDTKLKYLKPSTQPDIDTEWFDDDTIVRELKTFLREIILDNTFVHDPTSLSYFRRFLKMNEDSKSLLYLDFHQMVDSLKDPLEDAGTENIAIRYTDRESTQLKHIRESFFTDSNLQSMRELDDGLVNNVLLFTEKVTESHSSGFVLVRKSLLLLQSEALSVMNQDTFSKFKNSNMFLKMVASPQFISSEVYIEYFGSKVKKNADIYTDNREPVNNVQIFSNPGINDALEKIVNGQDKFDIRQNYAAQNSINNPPFFKSTGSAEADKKTFQFSDSDVDLFDDFPSNRSLPREAHKDRLPLAARDYDEGNSFERNDFLNSFMNNTVQDTSDLRQEIGQLTKNIEQIRKELDLLKHCILKADLMNNQQQLKLLSKSQAALYRDLEKKELLRQQFIVQENASSLFGNTKIGIKTYFTNKQTTGLRDIVYYVVNVDHIYNDQVSSWEVPRRYSDFYELHKHLKAKYPSAMKEIKHIASFPSKSSVSWTLKSPQASFIESRQIKFEKYMKALLNFPVICEDVAFRKFLTGAGYLEASSEDFKKKNHLNPVALSTSQSNSETSTVKSFSVSSNQVDPTNVAEEPQNRNSTTDSNNIHQSILKPICDLFITTFALDQSSSIWLRGGAFILVFQQLLGGAAEKYIRNTIEDSISAEQVHKRLASLKETLWGEHGYLAARKQRDAPPVRTALQKRQTARKARVMLSAVLLDMCRKVVGAKHAQEASTRIYSFLQNKYVLQSFLLSAIDIIFDEIVANSSN